MKKKKIAIVTVDYNEHEHTFELLDSLSLINKIGEVLTIVVDNGSKVPLLLKKVEAYKNTILLPTGINLGFAGGYNRGMKYAMSWGADFVFVLNNDTLVRDQDILAKLLEVFSDNKNAGIVSPKIYFAPGFEFHKDRYQKKDIGRVLWYAGGSINWKNVYSEHRGLDEVDRGQYDMIEKTGFISGCSFMIKREALLRAGYFDERFFAYFEDTDLIARLMKAGFEPWYCGQANIYHKVSQTAGIGSAFTDYLLTRNRLYLGFRYVGFKTKLALIREAIKQLVCGRPAQKKGIIDFVLRRFGPPRKQAEVPADYPFTVSIAIVNYKTKDLTLALVESIQKNLSGNLTSEIVVLDNGSGDGLIDQIKSLYPKVKTIALKENLGFSGGYNRALNFCRGKYFLLLNSDTEINKGSVEAMVAFLEAHPNSAVACKLILPDGAVQESAFVLPTVWGAIKKYWLGKKQAYGLYRPEGQGPQKVDGVVMAVLMLPAVLFYKLGELSEKTFMYFEDIEYGRRLKKEGISVYYLPEVSILHHHGASAKKVGDKAQRYLSAGAKVYHGKIKAWLISAVILTSQKFLRTSS